MYGIKKDFLLVRRRTILQENDIVWEFKATYCETGVGMSTPQDFFCEDVMPVVVNEKNYGEYVVLFDQILLQARSGINKPMYFTSVIRKIDLIGV